MEYMIHSHNSPAGRMFFQLDELFRDLLDKGICRNDLLVSNAPIVDYIEIPVPDIENVKLIGIQAHSSRVTSRSGDNEIYIGFRASPRVPYSSESYDKLKRALMSHLGETGYPYDSTLNYHIDMGTKRLEKTLYDGTVEENQERILGTLSVGLSAASYNPGIPGYKHKTSDTTIAVNRLIETYTNQGREIPTDFKNWKDPRTYRKDLDLLLKIRESRRIK